MKFKTEKLGLASLAEKEIPDPYSWDQGNRKFVGTVMLTNNKDLKKAFDSWLWTKRYMFAPSELIALIGEDHRGRKGQIDQKYRDKMVSVFVAWANGSVTLKQEMIEATKE